ncbi:MAG: tol-pal system protein YbgF [Thermodesulfobacteriota bacterium]|nr:tol-pal system protein YbgF [Thermodesulfobacteriota bacterium]
MRNTALLLFYSLLTLLTGCAPAPYLPGTTSIRPFEQQLKAQNKQLNHLDSVTRQLATTVSATQNELITLRAEIVALKARETTSVVKPNQQQQHTIVPTENPVATTQQSANDLYRNAFSAYTSSNYTTAVEGFNKFLQYYPGNPYVSNAHFWKGEAFLAQDALQPAIEAFNTVANDYPKAHKAPDALLKLARIYLTRDQRSQARSNVLTLRKHYANSTVNKKIPKDLLELID